MTYVNKFDKEGKCSKEGHSAEDLFESIAASKNYIITRSTKSENMHKHIDMFLEGKDQKTQEKKIISVDIKASKRTSRKDKNFNYEWVWVEIKNVQGRNGWLFGEADFIVFEQEEDFLLVSRKALVNFIKSNVRFDLDFVERASHAKYRIYQRKGRRDQITQIKLKDLLTLKNITSWKK
jgi:hypothetical protein